MSNTAHSRGIGRWVAREPRAGSSLVELMVAVVILTMIFGTAFSVVGQGYNIIENARDNARSAQILQSEMENIRILKWADVVALGENSTFYPTTQFASKFGDRYTCTRTITSRLSRPDQKECILRIVWTDTKGIAHSRQYFTYITEGGLNDYIYRSFY